MEMKYSIFSTIAKLWRARRHLISKIKTKIISRKRIKNYSIYAEALVGKSGIEIGGPSEIFKDNRILPIYKVIKNLDGCNFSDTTIWEGEITGGYNYKYHKLKPNGYQYITDAVDMRIIESSKYDFVLSCHSLEHIANLFKAISECLRILKNNGYLLMVVPHKEGTFDHKRPVTSIGHLIKDRDENIGEDDLTHLDEILKLHDLSMDLPAGNFSSFKKRSLENYHNRCLHHHVFDTNLVLQIIDYFGLQILAVDFVLPYHIITLNQKKNDRIIVNNAKFLRDDAKYRKNSPFKIDRKR